MWQQAGSASGFKNYVACELPQLLGTISDSTSVMQSLFSISLQVLQFCLADSSCVLQQWGTHFSVLLQYRAALRFLAEHECPAYIYQQVLYVWELKFMHLSRTWECIVIPLSRLLHYALFNSQCKPMYIYIHLHTNTCVSNIMQSKPLFFEAFGSSLRVVETSPRWAVLSWKRLGEGNLRFHPAGWGQILYCWCAPTNHGLHGRILAILGLMTVTAFYFDAYVVLKCLNA